MSWLRHWKVILSLLAIFIAGTVTGSFLTVRAIRMFANRNAMGPLIPLSPKWQSVAMKNYERRLKLTPEQMDKLRPAFEQAGNELGGVRTNTMTDVGMIIRRLNLQVEASLTPEQHDEFEKMREENRARYNRNKRVMGDLAPRSN